MIDCARIPFPIEISAKILYLAGAMDLGVNARKYLQVNPRKIEELESTSDLYKMCERRSEIISDGNNYAYQSKKKSKVSNKYITFSTRIAFRHDGNVRIRYYYFRCKGRINETTYRL
jgi:hypothetical protein